MRDTVHLTNGVWDPFWVPGPISNPILDIRGESFLNGKDVWLTQPAVVVHNALKRNTLGGVLVPPIQLLGLSIESLQARVADVTLIIPLMSAGGWPSGSFDSGCGNTPVMDAGSEACNRGFTIFGRRTYSGRRNSSAWMGWAGSSGSTGWGGGGLYPIQSSLYVPSSQLSGL